VATLGTLTLFRGFNSLLANGVQISADQVPQAWLDITTASIFGVPVVVFVAAGILSAIALGLRYLEVGRQLLAIGSNPGNGANGVCVHSQPLPTNCSTPHCDRRSRGRSY